MTMFRRLYWVTEEHSADGSVHATGVYTSVPDLLEKGLRFVGEESSHLTLKLIKLDSRKGPIGAWGKDNLGSLESEMQQFIETGEVSIEHVNNLVDGLHEFWK